GIRRAFASGRAFLLLPTFGGEVPRHTGRRGHESQRTAVPWLMTPPSPSDGDTSPAKLGRRMKARPNANPLPDYGGGIYWSRPRLRLDVGDVLGRHVLLLHEGLVLELPADERRADVAVLVVGQGAGGADVADRLAVAQQLDRLLVVRDGGHDRRAVGI